MGKHFQITFQLFVFVCLFQSSSCYERPCFYFYRLKQTMNIFIELEMEQQLFTWHIWSITCRSSWKLSKSTWLFPGSDLDGFALNWSPQRLCLVTFLIHMQADLEQVGGWLSFSALLSHRVCVVPPALLSRDLLFQVQPQPHLITGLLLPAGCCCAHSLSESW